MPEAAAVALSTVFSISIATVIGPTPTQEEMGRRGAMEEGWEIKRKVRGRIGEKKGNRRIGDETWEESTYIL